MKEYEGGQQVKKDDSTLWEWVERAKAFQCAMGITEPPFDLERALSAWRQAKEIGIPFTQQSRHYLIIIEPLEKEGFVAYCPAVENCTVQSSTREQAKEAIRLELARRLAETAQRGRSLPVERGSIEIVKVVVKQP